MEYSMYLFTMACPSAPLSKSFLLVLACHGVIASAFHTLYRSVTWLRPVYYFAVTKLCNGIIITCGLMLLPQHSSHPRGSASYCDAVYMYLLHGCHLIWPVVLACCNHAWSSFHLCMWLCVCACACVCMHCRVLCNSAINGMFSWICNLLLPSWALGLNPSSMVVVVFVVSLCFQFYI